MSNTRTALPEQLFSDLCREAADCNLCPRMLSRRAVLSPLNGALHPLVMFIAEAPGRNGADRTRIPFHGDASGVNFERLLASINLTRKDVFITNSVLCSPRKESGANDKPRRDELRNCSDFLRRQIEIVDPPLIATLGAVALENLKLIAPHSYRLKSHAAQILDWQGRLLVPLYHPSPRVIAAARSLDEQLRDFAALGRAIKNFAI